MQEFLMFFNQHGVRLSVIACVGIALLGIMKYSGMFKKIDETKRHYVYLAISVGLSVLGSVIYLACVDNLDWNYIALLSSMIYALNQTWYNIFKVTPVNEIGKSMLDLIKLIFTRKDDTK